MVSRTYEPNATLGSYLLRRLLGEGAIGRVYLAEHRELGRKVALKVLRSEFAQNPVVVKRFFGEARAVNQIAHENIVEITDFVRSEDGCYYIMELLYGETLAQRAMRLGGFVPVGPLVRVARQIAGALQAVHDVGIVHRDLKPENVFLTLRDGDEDFVKVLDFGVAKLAKGDQHAHRTVAGTLVGTPEYMSPEQAIGGTVDHRADIYSLGAMLYELSTGRRIFPRAQSIREMIDAHLDQSIVPPTSLASMPQDLPPGFESLVMRCLEKDVGKRIQTMREVEQRLEEIDQQTSDVVQVRLTEGWAPKPGAIALAAALIMLPLFGITYALVDEDEPVRIATMDREVELMVESTPHGATVTHVETGERLGRTPLVTRIGRSERPQHLLLELAGYQTVKHEVTPDRPHRTSVMLTELQRPPR